MAKGISKVSVFLFIVGLSLIVLISWVLFSDVTISSEVRYGVEAFIAALVWGFLLVITMLRDRRLSFYWVLLLVAYPFFFGQQVLASLGLKTKLHMISLTQISDDVAWGASFFIMVCVIVVTLVYLLTREENLPETPSVHLTTASIDNAALRKACTALLVVLALPTVYYLMKNIMLSNTVGYGVRITDAIYSRSGMANWDTILAQIVPFVLLGLVITRKQGEKWQFLCLACYFFLYLLSGSRISLFCFIPTLAYVWSALFSTKPLRRQLLNLLLILLVFSLMFSIVSLIRGLSSSTISSNLIVALTENNALVSIFQEAGQTFVVTAAAIAYIPDMIDFSFGYTYLSGIVYVLPNQLTGGFYASVDSVDELLSPFLTSYGGVGSSFIAEGYLNFGYFSIIIFALYGLIIGKLTNFAERQLAKGKKVGLFIACACFLLMAIFIRSDTRTFLRNFVWAVLPVLILQQLLQSRMIGFRKKKQSAESTSLMLP